MSRNHTKTPWKVRNCNGSPSLWTADEVHKVAQFFKQENGLIDHRYGNALLCAAAPELLEALKSCFAECERQCIGDVDLMRRAIAKAEGHPL